MKKCILFIIIFILTLNIVISQESADIGDLMISVDENSNIKVTLEVVSLPFEGCTDPDAATFNRIDSIQNGSYFKFFRSNMRDTFQIAYIHKRGK
jgi:hypothetical protein